jgi:hypothetical protein
VLGLAGYKLEDLFAVMAHHKGDVRMRPGLFCAGIVLTTPHFYVRKSRQ